MESKVKIDGNSTHFGNQLSLGNDVINISSNCINISNDRGQVFITAQDFEIYAKTNFSNTVNFKEKVTFEEHCIFSNEVGFKSNVVFHADIDIWGKAFSYETNPSNLELDHARVLDGGLEVEGQAAFPNNAEFLANAVFF